MELVGKDSDPVEIFRKWFSEASAAGEPEPEAMTLATCAPDGVPSARTVLLKDFGPGGFVFYTNLGSAKSRELAANPGAALLFYWKAMSRQVRVRGRVEAVDRETVGRYFHSRPRESQVGAWASRQSEPIGDYGVLRDAVERRTAEFAGGEVPLPDHWGGFRLRALSVEFWLEGANRLHGRTRFVRGTPDGEWQAEHLYP